MKWATSASFEADLAEAFTQVREDLASGLNWPPDLLLLFLTPHYQDQIADLPGLVETPGPARTLGCTATGVIGGGREVEDRACLAATAAVLPGTAMTPFHLQAGDLPDLDAAPERWHEALGVDPEPPPHFLLLADPTGPSPLDPRPLLMGLDFAYPGAAKIGGLASVLQENRLILDGRIVTGGCVGVALQGGVEVDTIVAQGCRAIGPPMTVTGCSGYFLEGLDGRPAVERLVEIYHEAGAEDQERMQTSLHIGVAATGLKLELGAGDFLIRNVLQLDHEKGVIAVGDRLSSGQTVQFHVRDAAAATQDLDQLLARYRSRQPEAAPAGGLLFTCTGRGHRFFGRPGHDSGRLEESLGQIPLGGFFCGGEIGPVGDTTYLHGYTSSFALFRPPS